MRSPAGRGSLGLWCPSLGCAAVAFVAGLWNGCAPSTQGHVPQSAAPPGLIQVPDHFLVGDPGATATREPAAGEGCHDLMVDPRDGTRIQLARSSNGLGDYEVPEGRYGVGTGNLLRLDCANGRVMGVIRR